MGLQENLEMSASVSRRHLPWAAAAGILNILGEAFDSSLTGKGAFFVGWAVTPARQGGMCQVRGAGKPGLF